MEPSYIQEQRIEQRTVSNKIVLKKWKSLDDIIKAHPSFKPDNIQKTLDGLTKSAHNFFWSYYVPEPEVYKTIKEFPDFDVSTYGNVRNNQTGENVEKGLDKMDGFQYVVLHDGNSKNKYSRLLGIEHELCYVHFLVVATFFGNPDFIYSSNYNPIVYHKDGNKLDNSCENLTFDRPFKLPVQINQIDMKNGKVIKTFGSLDQVRKAVPKVSDDLIIKTCEGQCNSAGGYAWEYCF